jgi:predicted nucleic acid-binding protein
VSYIDSSSLLKLLWEEPESEAVRAVVAEERTVVVSVLAELETLVQLRARWRAGSTTSTRHRAYVRQLESLRHQEPFAFADLSGGVFRLALAQHAGSREHCRTLDRLHLAAMQELGLRRLLTNDVKQARAGRAMGFQVVVPGA